MRKLTKSIIAALLTTAASSALAQNPATITSVWASSEGQITFTQQGQTMNGTYPTDNGRIFASKAGNRLVGVWVESASDRRCDRPMKGSYYWGRIQFDFGNNGNFTGSWSYCDGAVLPGNGSWSGRLLRADVPDLQRLGFGTFTFANGSWSNTHVPPAPRPIPGPGPIANPLAQDPCYSNTYAVANIGPCTARVGSTLTVQRLRTTPSPLGALVFKAVLASGVPAQVIVPLTGVGGSAFHAVVPAQLCARGGPKWDVWLRTADGQNQGSIGSFQPDCR